MCFLKHIFFCQYKVVPKIILYLEVDISSVFWSIVIRYHLKRGELSKWLLDLGYVEKSAQLDRLSKNESMLLTKICEILEINPNLTEEEIKYF